MIAIRKKIESVMTGAGKSPVMSLASFLYMISVGFAGIQKLRGTWYRRQLSASKRLPCKVISIGNITVGGTGKTPMTMYVAKRMKRFGYRVAVVSRGYKGGAEQTETIVSDGRQILTGPEIAGDEPYMHACRLPGIAVIVGKNRFAAGMLAINTFQPEVIVLDDGFQHMRLTRDIDLVLLDYRRPFGNLHLLPRGTLREPQKSLARADAFVLTRSAANPQSGSPSVTDRLKSIAPHCPVFSSSHNPYFFSVPRRAKASLADLSRQAGSKLPDSLARRRVLAFSGLARNDDFKQSVEDFHCDVTRFLQFPDHHPYSDSDFKSIVRAAKHTSAEFLITTEKDYARIAHRTDWPLELIVIGVEISFGEDEERFDEFLKERISK
jgi:tetraacyldisaccharide 4'-kinase